MDDFPLACVSSTLSRCSYNREPNRSFQNREQPRPFACTDQVGRLATSLFTSGTLKKLGQICTCIVLTTSPSCFMAFGQRHSKFRTAPLAWNSEFVMSTRHILLIASPLNFFHHRAMLRIPMCYIISQHAVPKGPLDAYRMSFISPAM